MSGLLMFIGAVVVVLILFAGLTWFLNNVHVGNQPTSKSDDDNKI